MRPTDVPLGAFCFAQWDEHEHHRKGGKTQFGPAWVHVKRLILGWLEVGTPYVWAKNPSRVLPLHKNCTCQTPVVTEEVENGRKTSAENHNGEKD